MSLLQEEGMDTMWFCHGNVAAVPRLRNRIVREAIDHDATDLVFIDSDINWNAQDLKRLLEHDVDIVAGVMPTNSTRTVSGKTFPFRPLNGKVILRDNLIEVEAVPTAFLRIRGNALRDLADKSEQVYMAADNGGVMMAPALFKYATLPLGPDGQLMMTGEDFSFCHFAREHGYKIYADPSIRLGHMKSIVLTGTLKEWIEGGMQ
jgi:GT2 family glycosyltransferase